jgi:hypothetical protein
MKFGEKEKTEKKLKQAEESPADRGKVKQQMPAPVAQAASAAGDHARMVAGDIWHGIRTEKTAQLLVLLLIFSVVFWEVAPISYALYPFKLFVTVIHESCHALAARLTGGNVGFISIAADHSGLTSTMGGFQPLVMMAGYLGTAIFGGLLIYWGRFPARARFILNTIGTVILALTVFYGGGGFFSFIAMLLIGAAILYVSRKASDKVCHMFLLLLAVQTTLEGVISIQDLFLISVFNNQASSDAKNLETLTGIPAVCWSVLFAVLSTLILIYAFWISYKPAKKEVAVTADSKSPPTLSS